MGRINDFHRIYSTKLCIGLSRAIRGQFSIKGPSAIHKASIFHYQPVRLLLPEYRPRFGCEFIPARPNALMPYGRVPSPIARSRPGQRRRSLSSCEFIEATEPRARARARARSRTSPAYEVRAYRSYPGELYEDLTGERARYGAPQVFSPSRIYEAHPASRNARSLALARARTGRTVHPPVAGNANTCIRRSLIRPDRSLARRRGHYVGIKAAISNSVPRASERASFDGNLSSCLLRCSLSL